MMFNQDGGVLPGKKHNGRTVRSFRRRRRTRTHNKQTKRSNTTTSRGSRRHRGGRAGPTQAALSHRGSTESRCASVVKTQSSRG